MGKKIIFALMFVFLISLVSGIFEGVVIDPSEEISSFTVISHQNSSDYWDDLDVPADIPNSKFWVNDTLITFNLYNSTWDTSGGVTESDPIWTRNWSLGFFVNDTLIVFNLWNSTWDTSGIVDTDSQYTHLTNFTDDMNLSINHTKTTFDLYNSTWDTSGLVDTDSQYTHLTNFTDDMNLSINHTITVFNLWNATWDNTDTNSIYTHLTNFTDDMNLSINHTSTVYNLWDGRWYNIYTHLTNFTDDMNLSINHTETTFNLYNSTWDNQASAGDNSSWNQSFANTLYAPNTTVGLQFLLNATGIYADSNVSALCAAGDVQMGEAALLCLDLNVSIDARTASTTYLPTLYNVTGGGLDYHADILALQIADENYTVNITEAAGAPPVLDIRINFTGVVDFNTIILHEWYIGGAGHEIAIGIFDYTDGTYEEEYGELTDMSDFGFLLVNVLDASSHISNGVVSVQLRHEQNGFPTHKLVLDYIALVDGFSTITTSEHDALAGRDDSENHPWAMPRDGSKNFTGNVSLGGNSLKYLEYFCIGSCSQDYSESNFTNYLKNQTLEVYTLWDDRWTAVPDNSSLSYCGNITGAASDLCTITATAGNVSWNQSFANTLYAPNTTVGLQFLLNDTGIYDTIPDTNVSTACGDDEVMMGNDALALCIDLNATIDDRDSDTIYTAGSNITITSEVIAVDITNLLVYLKTVLLDLAGGSITGNLNMTDNNITNIDCMVFESGGSWCSA